MEHKNTPSVTKFTDIEISEKGLIFTNMKDLILFSEMIAKSELCPKHLKNNAENVFLTINFGIELGIKPLQSLQSISVINGIPAIFGDAAKALVQASGECEKFEEFFLGTPYNDDFTAVCITKRKDQDKEYRYEFSVADAKLAKLWTKEGTWKTYPKRMLMFKARGFNLRDNFTSILRGFKTVEEVDDYEIISSNNYKSDSGNIKKKGVGNMMKNMDLPPED